MDDASLSVRAGSLTGLIGPNGAGKSTMINLISGFERADSGQILFDGQRIEGKSPHAISQLGLMRSFQSPREWPGLTVMENMLLATPIEGRETVWRGLLTPGRLRAAESRDRVLSRELLDEVGLLKLKNEPAGNLSGGQKRLLEFARLAAARPRLVLLDEPQAGVNPVLVEPRRWWRRTVTVRDGSGAWSAPGAGGGTASRSRLLVWPIMGLLIATLVTKVVVPVLYVLFVEDFKLIRWDAPDSTPSKARPPSMPTPPTVDDETRDRHSIVGRHQVHHRKDGESTSSPADEPFIGKQCQIASKKPCQIPPNLTSDLRLLHSFRIPLKGLWDINPMLALQASLPALPRIPHGRHCPRVGLPLVYQ